MISELYCFMSLYESLFLFSSSVSCTVTHKALFNCIANMDSTMTIYRLQDFSEPLTVPIFPVTVLEGDVGLDISQASHFAGLLPFFVFVFS